MKNIEFLIGVGLGAAIACAVVSRCGKCACDCKDADENFPADCFCAPLVSFPCGCLPPKKKPPKKKDPCKGCYYEKYERKSCG